MHDVAGQSRELGDNGPTHHLKMQEIILEIDLLVIPRLPDRRTARPGPASVQKNAATGQRVGRTGFTWCKWERPWSRRGS